MSSSLLSTASWVVVRQSNGEVLFETFNARLVEALNTAVYRAVPILEYLQSLNKKP